MTGHDVDTAALPTVTAEEFAEAMRLRNEAYRTPMGTSAAVERGESYENFGATVG